MAEAWVAQLSGALAAAAGLPPDTTALAPAEVERLLDAARDVAHLTERRNTPLACFVLGRWVGTVSAAGTPPDQALDQALAVLRATLPGPPTEG